MIITELTAKLKDVTRHSVDGYGRQDICYNVPEGEFVFYSDYEALTEALEAAQSRIAELEARTLTAAANDVLAERLRQISAEGWTPEHDDEYQYCEMAVAAACYIMADDDPRAGVPELWPCRLSGGSQPMCAATWLKLAHSFLLKLSA